MSEQVEFLIKINKEEVDRAAQRAEVATNGNVTIYDLIEWALEEEFGKESVKVQRKS